jgi:hypothetical protein
MGHGQPREARLITHSYITTVLESYEIADRQIRWLGKILPDCWELIFVDDGSVPEIRIPDGGPRNMTVIRSGDVREWTQGLARNMAAKKAAGEYLLFSDIDHVFTAGAIGVATRFRGDILHFRRQAGILGEDLEIHPDPQPVYARAPNIFLIRRSLFLELGGYCDKAGYGEDIGFLREVEEKTGNAIPQDESATITVICGNRMRFHHLARPW